MTAEILTDPIHGLELLRRTYTRCDDPDPDLPVVVSLFSGIEGIGAGLALNGFQVVVAVEYDPECQRVLRARFPEIVIYSDVREVDPDEIRRIVGGRRVVLTGGFPCQDLSVAGGRAGLAGERSGLYRELLRIADALDPDWIIIENVAGLLSADIDPEANDGTGWGAGTAMALLLGDVTGYRPAVPAGGWRSSGMCVGGKRTLCWRVLDARHFGVAQRRRRVFVVACPRDRSAPAAVLLEPEGVRGDPPPGEPPRPRSARRASPSAVPAGEAAADRGGEDGAGPGVDTVSTLQAAGGDRGWRLDAEGAAGGHIVPSSGLDDGETARALMTGEQGHRHDPSSATYVVDEVSALTTRHHADRGDSADLGKLVAAPTPILEVGARTGVSTDDPRAGMGVGEPGDPMFTLQAGKQHGVAYAPEQAATLTAGVSASEGVNPPGRRQEDDVNLVAVESVTGEHTHALTSEGADASEDGTGRGTPIIAVPPWRRGKRAVEPQLDPDHGAVPIEVRNALRGGGATGVGTPGTGVGEDGDPAPTLGTAVTPAVATFRKQRRAADPTDDETWVEGDVANTLNTFDGIEPPVAFHATQDPITSEDYAPAMGTGSSSGCASVGVATAETVGGVGQDRRYVDAAQTRSREVLRGLRDEAGEEAAAQWLAGVAAALRSSSLLRPGVHGEGDAGRPEAGDRRLDDGASEGAEDLPAGAVREVRVGGRDGRPSPQRGPQRQPTDELAEVVSLLSQPDARAESALLGLRDAAEGSRLLRQALSAVEEVGRPARHQGQPAHARDEGGGAGGQVDATVRRLTPRLPRVRETSGIP